MRLILVTPALATALVFLSLPAVAQTFREASPGAIGFGGAAAIAGDEILVGRPGTLIGFPIPASHAGAVHVFRRSGNGWRESGLLGPKDGRLGDGFGTALTVDGNLLAIGAPGAEAGGAVYVYERTGNAWTQRARLTGTGGAAADRFGAAVALKGTVLLVGAPGRDGERGAVVVFSRGKSAAQWTSREVIQGSGTAANDWFGAALSFDGRRALVGAPGPWTFDSTRWKPGTAFVFRASPRGKWAEDGRLVGAPDQRIRALGVSVLLDGEEAMVGAPLSDSLAGAVVRWRREAAGWAPAGAVIPDSVVRPGAFGAALARDGGDLLIGAPTSDKSVGAVHVFRRSGGGDWKSVQKLVTPPAGYSTRLGASVVAQKGLSVAGAPLAYFFEGVGLVYQRDGSAGVWREVATVNDTVSTVLPAVAGGEVKCEGGKAKGFDCKDADLVAFLPKSTIGAKHGTLLNDLWGWTDSTTRREFALVGRTDGTSFVEVTDPANPKYLGDLPHASGRARQHLARHQGLQESRLHRRRRLWPAWHAGLRSHPASERQDGADVPGDRHLHADQQRAQHRHQREHRLRLHRRQQHGRRDLRRRAAHDRHPRSRQSNVRRLLRRPRAGPAAHRTDPRRPVRDLSRARRPVSWPRDLLQLQRERARHRRRDRQEQAQDPEHRGVSQRRVRAPGVAHRGPALLLPR